MGMRIALVLAVIAIGFSPAGTRGQSRPAALRVYATPCYLIRTDLDEDEAREAVVRTTRMAEEYRQRTKGFSGRISQRLPFYLFRHEADYIAAGGRAGTVGVFTGEKLMAVAGEHPDDRTWHTVQHEGFHQFARSVIRGDLPAWVNEGLAEYFGEGRFTGDSLITGLLPPWRLSRVKRSIEEGRFRSLRDMMLLSYDDWNGEMALVNYDQAWSMAHFLIHADQDKYQSAFVSFLNAVGRGAAYEKAWLDAFGPPEEFEARWRKYYLDLPDDPTAELYDRVLLSTMTSFLARATSQKQSFPSFDAFLAAGRNEQIKSHPDDWLPPALLQETIKALDEKGHWSLEMGPSKLPQLAREYPDGVRVIGSFTLDHGRVDRIAIGVDDLAKTVVQAKALLAEKKKTKARDLLRDGLKAHPASPATQEARQLLVQTRQ